VSHEPTAELHLQNNLITGIDGLHEGMSGLSKYFFHHRSHNECAPYAKSLRLLLFLSSEVLSLGGNQIADISTVYTLTSLGKLRTQLSENSCLAFSSRPAFSLRNSKLAQYSRRRPY
jgi:hypothetical protein